MDFETRSFAEHLRANEEGKWIGYAVVFNSLSHDLGGFREVIAPGAFTRSLTEYPDVFGLVEHDPTKILGRTRNGTLTLTQDDHGLRVELLPNLGTSYARDLKALIEREDVGGWSFRFRPYKGGTETRNGIRTITAAQLKEISIVANPAYPATEESGIASRALDANSPDIARRHARLRLLTL